MSEGNHHVLKLNPVGGLGPFGYIGGAGHVNGNTQVAKIKGKVNNEYGQFIVNSATQNSFQVSRFKAEHQQVIAAGLSSSGAKIKKAQLVFRNTFSGPQVTMGIQYSTDGGSSFSTSQTGAQLNQSPADFVDKESNATDYFFDIRPTIFQDIDINTYNFTNFQVRVVLGGTTGQYLQIDSLEVLIHLGTEPAMHLKSGNTRIKSGNVVIKK